jgi:hypothetical protein
MEECTSIARDYMKGKSCDLSRLQALEYEHAEYLPECWSREILPQLYGCMAVHRLLNCLIAIEEGHPKGKRDVRVPGSAADAGDYAMVKERCYYESPKGKEPVFRRITDKSLLPGPPGEMSIQLEVLGEIERLFPKELSREGDPCDPDPILSRWAQTPIEWS